MVFSFGKRASSARRTVRPPTPLSNTPIGFSRSALGSMPRRSMPTPRTLRNPRERDDVVPGGAVRDPEENVGAEMRATDEGIAGERPQSGGRERVEQDARPGTGRAAP